MLRNIHKLKLCGNFVCNNVEKGFYKTLKGTLMISSITFEEKITGQANLIFPAEKMRKFINLCISQNNECIENYMSF
ncbi:hypothetical protein [Clostridium cochlearium]|uniref:hypothetical protein n=1 Tax=Clostridium cochlearium TaxID=1494 RepID=UPI000B94D104|nr:hypothetical protein [Clostridium cochlearium]MBV1816756.1 hypothetical protein [Bacteroidales bacterium MSK.15.36]MCG4579192.1 hypothetical protein [Clostridium cochlearium]MCR1971051.1 hypothetical protein [Clostridium cochlearium]MDU1442607.1 hypothetical protein [Clostridium cochlearium]SNV88319.1 Uncharacterised protein [Clostridium cochlearium]